MGTNIHMLTEERYRIILDRLAADGRVLANDLAARFGVSEDTVRRDLRELAKAGECRRVYGGAVPIAPHAGPARVRASLAVEAKQSLANAAVRLLSSGQLIFFDAGTTNIAVAKALPADLKLTVATNSIGVAVALADRPAVSLIVLGGTFDPEHGACVGAETRRAIAGLSADLVFLGACGADPSVGVTAFNENDAETKRAMVDNSRHVAIAATTDKLGTAAPFRVADTALITHLVVEDTAPAGLLKNFAARGCRIHVA